MCSATLGEIEDLFSDTMTKVEDTHKRLVELENVAMINARAHETIAQAIQLMSQTFKSAEERQGSLEETNQELYKAKTSSVSPTAFLLVVGTLCVVIVLGAVQMTDTYVKATATSFEAGRKQAEIQKEIIDKVTDGQ